MDFEITVQRAKKHNASLKSLIQNIDGIADRAIEHNLAVVVEFLVGEVKKRTPVDTGVLRNSVFAEVNTQGTSLEGLVSTAIVYGPPVEFGRKANDSGKGGFEGRHMFRDAWQEEFSTISRLLNEVGVTIAEELLKKL